MRIQKKASGTSSSPEASIKTAATYSPTVTQYHRRDTTNARHTKYCGGYAPGDKLHRTCRQIGNLKGREQRELADDHPIIQIYEKRLNTINRYVKRGTLDADLAEVMKKLAKDKMLRAKSDVAYAKGAYEKEMEQVALKKEAYNK